METKGLVGAGCLLRCLLRAPSAQTRPGQTIGIVPIAPMPHGMAWNNNNNKPGTLLCMAERGKRLPVSCR